MARSDYPKLLVIKEKHGNTNYLVNSAEEVNRIATDLVRKRASLGYYYETDVQKIVKHREKGIDNLIESSGLTREIAPRTPEGVQEIANLKVSDEVRAAKLLGVDPAIFSTYPAVLKEQAISGAKSYLAKFPRIFSNYQQEIDDAENILKIVNTEKAEELEIEHRGRKYNLALWILDGRRDYEYEGFDYEPLEPVPTAEDLEASRKS